MKYTSAAAFRQALDQRLKNEAASTGLGVARLRKRVAFEVFLRRLFAVAPDRWVLKGALALDLRLASPPAPPRTSTSDATTTSMPPSVTSPRHSSSCWTTSSPAPPTIWADPYKRLADTVDIEPDLVAAFSRAAGLLDPVLAGHAHGQWDTQRRKWLPPAP